MHARKLVTAVSNDAPASFRERLVSAAATTEVEAVAKDVHLVWAAVRTGNAIISRDEAMRGNMKRIAASRGEIGDVEWTNPEAAQDGTTEWVAGDAPMRNSFRLRPRT